MSHEWGLSGLIGIMFVLVAWSFSLIPLLAKFFFLIAFGFLTHATYHLWKMLSTKE